MAKSLLRLKKSIRKVASYLRAAYKTADEDPSISQGDLEDLLDLLENLLKQKNNVSKVRQEDDKIFAQFLVLPPKLVSSKRTYFEDFEKNTHIYGHARSLNMDKALITSCIESIKKLCEKQYAILRIVDKSTDHSYNTFSSIVNPLTYIFSNAGSSYQNIIYRMDNMKLFPKPTEEDKKKELKKITKRLTRIVVSLKARADLYYQQLTNNLSTLEWRSAIEEDFPTKIDIEIYVDENGIQALIETDFASNVLSEVAQDIISQGDIPTVSVPNQMGLSIPKHLFPVILEDKNSFCEQFVENIYGMISLISDFIVGSESLSSSNTTNAKEELLPHGSYTDKLFDYLQDLDN